MKFFFIIKPPVKKPSTRAKLGAGLVPHRNEVSGAGELEKEILEFKKIFEIKEELTEEEGERNAQNLAKKAIGEGFERIIVVGGDGLLNEAVNGIMGAIEGNFSSNFALGIIPTGAGNNFAKELGIKNIREAFSVIKQNKKILVDLGKVNERYFANCVSFGFDALINKIANDIKTKYQFLPRNLSYLLAALGKIIIGIPNFQIQIKGEINYQNKVVLVAITNSPSYGGIFKVNPGALINDGKLNLCLIKPVGKIRAFEILFRVTKGTHLNLPEVKTFQFSSLLTVSSPENLPFETDGEVFEPEKKYQIEVFPKILPVLVP